MILLEVVVYLCPRNFQKVNKIYQRNKINKKLKNLKLLNILKINKKYNNKI